METRLSFEQTLNKFHELLTKIKEADEALTIDIEPMLESLLDFIVLHPHLRHEFADVFVRMLYCWHIAPVEVFEYCMHALRWDEVKRTIEGRNQFALTKREEFFVSRSLDCFKDDWDRAVLYRLFTANP